MKHIILADSTRAMKPAVLKRDVFPVLGNTLITEITVGKVRDLCDKLAHDFLGLIPVACSFQPVHFISHISGLFGYECPLDTLAQAAKFPAYEVRDSASVHTVYPLLFHVFASQ